MIRKLQYRIEERDSGKNIGLFLKEREYSRAVIIELKKTRTGIMKNGAWACVNEMIETGDIIEICLMEEAASEKIAPQEQKLDILYEDEDILIVNKPYNTPVHPSINNYDNTLANGIVHYARNQPYVFRCINRLDRDTTGTVMIAKNMLSAGILSNRVKENCLSRIYLAFAEGITEEAGIVNLPIGRAEGTIIKRKVDEAHGKEAVTHYQRLDVINVEGQPVSAVALKLDTGRTHQIRVHMAHIGHPLLGDFLYNENNHMLTRQGLHAARLGFVHPITGENMAVTAPLPEDMKRLMLNQPEADRRLVDLAFKLQNIQW